MPDTVFADPDSIDRPEDEYGGRTDASADFGPARPVYLNFAMKSFQRQMAYKFEYFVALLNGLLFIFIFTSLWGAIYRNSEAAASAPFDMKGIITYAVFAMIFRISMSMEDLGVAQKVRTGAISMDLIKPVNYSLMLFSEAVGYTLFHWFSRVVPILVISLLAFDVSLPNELSNYALAGVAWTLGYAISFLLSFAFALLAFWFLETFSFQLMKFGLFTLFSGGIVPIDFFPDWLRPVIDVIPFQYILYVPTSLFIGHIQGGQALRLIFLQFVWVVILALLGGAMWRSARRKLVVQGG